MTRSRRSPSPKAAARGAPKPSTAARFVAPLRRRARLVVGVVAGFAAWAVASRAGVPAPGLIGWDVGGLIYLVGLWHLFLSTDEAELRRHAGDEDEKLGIILALLVAAVGVSVAALLVVLADAQPDDGASRIVALVTLLISWTLLHSVYTLHYAHDFFGKGGDGKPRGGLDFPGSPPSSYLDFVYFAFCIGATFQVSDVDATSLRLRRVIVVHAVLSFLFNTVILALAINMAAAIVGK